MSAARVAGSALLASVGLTACGGTKTAELPPEPVTVTVTDNAFRRDGRDRPTVRVAPGTTVKWRWVAQQSHELTVRSGPARFNSPTLTKGSYSRRVVKPGTYELVCSLHAPGMKMRVVVQ